MSAVAGEIFKPGEKCKQSGIYTVIHDPNHHEMHQVTCVNGKPFPPCNHCGHHVRFKLKIAAQHLDTHPEFKK